MYIENLFNNLQPYDNSLELNEDEQIQHILRPFNFDDL